MLYEMVTGALPFNGTVQQLIDHHARTAPPAIRARMPSAPEALDALVLSLMQKHPAERPRSAAEVLDALAGILEQESTAMAPAELSRGSSLPSVKTMSQNGTLSSGSRSRKRRAQRSATASSSRSPVWRWFRVKPYMPQACPRAQVDVSE